MYGKLIFIVFLKGTICGKGGEWLLPIIHQSILYNGGEKTYNTMCKNAMFFRCFPIVMRSKFYTFSEKTSMIGDAWNLFFNPHLPFTSPIKDIIV